MTRHPHPPASLRTLGLGLCVVACGPPAVEPVAECFHAPVHAVDSTCMQDVGELPATLDALGCFTERGGVLEPDPGLVPYAVAAPLFSDFADKQRFAWLPPGTSLSSAGGALDLPPGAALFKHFHRGGLPIETRVIHRGADGLVYATYVWEAGQAHLSTTGAQVVLPLDGGEEVWTVPSADACTFCHGADEALLGFAPNQLAREICVDGETLDQLAAWEAWGLGTVRASRPLASPSGSAPLAERVRSDLHANCAHCHRRGGWAVDIDLDLRFETALVDTRTCGVPNQYFTSSASPAIRLVPGDPDGSSLVWRMETGTDVRMPPFGVHADPQGVARLRAWIEQLEGCPN